MTKYTAGASPVNSSYRLLLRTLLLLSFPTIVEEILSTLLQYVDTAMVGQLGEQATASVSITTNVTWLVNSVAGAAGTAVLVLISRAAGAGDEKQVKKLSQQALLLALVSGAVLFAAPFLTKRSRVRRWLSLSQENKMTSTVKSE